MTAANVVSKVTKLKLQESKQSIPTVSKSASFHLYMVVCLDSAIHFTKGFSRPMLPQQCEASKAFSVVTSFYLCALSLSLPAAIVFCLFDNWILFSFSFSLSSFSVAVPECTEGIRQ